MILRSDELQSKKMHELRSIVTNLGMGWSKTEKKADLIERIIIQETTAQPTDRPEKTDDANDKRDVACAVKLLPDDVFEALKPYMHRGLKLAFSTDGNNWRIKWGLKEDSGNMTMPLKTIVRCADMITPPIVTEFVDKKG